jgi:hypothetical protein
MRTRDRRNSDPGWKKFGSGATLLFTKQTKSGYASDKIRIAARGKGKEKAWRPLGMASAGCVRRHPEAAARHQAGQAALQLAAAGLRAVLVGGVGFEPFGGGEEGCWLLLHIQAAPY